MRDESVGQDNDAKPNRVPPWLLRLGITVTLLLSLAFFYRAAQALPDLPAITPQVRSALLTSALAGVLLLLVTHVLSATVWLILLRSLQRASPAPDHQRKLWGTYFVAQFARYLPGNVMHQIGRMVLVVRLGYSKTAAATSQVLELLILVAVGGCIGLGAVADMGAIWLGGEPAADISARVLWLGLGAAGAVAAVPFALKLLSGRHPSLGEVRPGALLRACALASLLTATSFALAAGAVYLAGAALAPELNVPVWLVITRVTLCWVAGIVTPGAPAGVGVREFLLLAALSPLYGEPVALLLSLGLRLLGLLADAMSFALGLWLTADLRRDAKGTMV